MEHPFFEGTEPLGFLRKKSLWGVLTQESSF